MRTIITITLACFLSACAHMHIVCQDVGTTSLAVGGNTAGQQILSLGLAVAGAAASGAKIMAATPPKDTAATAQSQSYIDYNYMPIFGSDFASCSALPPAQPPSVAIMFVSANGQIQTVETQSHQVVVAPPQK